jgi:3-oxoacyl-[acyl-carrier-protein] synthase-3
LMNLAGISVLSE